MVFTQSYLWPKFLHKGNRKKTQKFYHYQCSYAMEYHWYFPSRIALVVYFFQELVWSPNINLVYSRFDTSSTTSGGFTCVIALSIESVSSSASRIGSTFSMDSMDPFIGVKWEWGSWFCFGNFISRFFPLWDKVDKYGVFKGCGKLVVVLKNYI